ncbi:MAG: hypothetical protein ABL892_04680 [Thiobacillaceae bacterium]
MASALSAAFAINACAVDGPSSSASPYLVPIASGASFTSILSVGDRVSGKNKNAYRMVGLPDGLGAYDNGDGTMSVLMNHELSGAAGVVRAHGARGAFVSSWKIRKRDLKVLYGEDLIQTVMLWNGTNYVAANHTVFQHLCSGDLPAKSAFFNRVSGKGFNTGRFFMSGEEIGGTGRAFAHLAQGHQRGTSYELPRLGHAAWENLLASPFEQDKTIVAGMDDSSLNASRVYFYVGNKQTSGNPVERAGLSNGVRYALTIEGFATEDSVNDSVPIPNAFSGRFKLVTAAGSGLNRVEDGAWDTRNPRRFYFVTTASFTGNSRLWRVTFDDITHPENGGEIEVLIDGATIANGSRMMDNLTVDTAGNIIIQEDIGNQTPLGKIWRYDTRGELTRLAEHDASRFVAGAVADIDGTGSKQSDEESSGVIEVSDLFSGVQGYDTRHYRYFLLDVQAHYSSVNGVALDAELVEGGQLLLMRLAR